MRARKRTLWVNLRFKTPVNYHLPVFLTGFLQVIYRKPLLGKRICAPPTKMGAKQRRKCAQDPNLLHFERSRRTRMRANQIHTDVRHESEK